MPKGFDIDKRRYASDKSGTVPTFFKYPGFRFMMLYRMARAHSRHSLTGLIARIWFKRLQVKYGFQIPITCEIGDGLFLGHFGNIVINQGATIGKNCNIAQGVTIGYVSRGKRQGCPVIGDRVWIGANAVIVGNVRIGNDVLIAPLSFVNFDVPDGAVVSGNPAVIISDRGSQGYVKNQV